MSAEFPRGVKGGVGAGVDYLARSLNQTNQCIKITIKLFSAVGLFA